MGKSVSSGDNGFDFGAAFDSAIKASGKPVAKTKEQQATKEKGFDFNATFDESLKKKDGGSESSPIVSESILPAPADINTAYQNYQNKKATDQDVKILQQTPWAKENGVANIPKEYIPIFTNAHNGETREDLTASLLHTVIDPFYPQTQDPKQNAARQQIISGMLSGNQQTIQKIKGAVVQSIQKQIDDRANQLKVSSSNALDIRQPAVSVATDPIIKKLREQVAQVTGTIDEFGINALVNSNDAKAFLDLDKNHPQLITSTAAGKIGKQIQDTYGLDNTSGNIEYERNKAGLSQIIRNAGMEYNATLKQAMLTKNPELLKQAQEKASQLTRYADWYNKLDSEQFTDVGTANTARFIGDIVSEKHPGKWIVTKADVDEAAKIANERNPGWMDKYGKFLGTLEEHPQTVPAPGFGGAFLRGSAKMAANIVDWAKDASVASAIVNKVLPTENLSDKLEKSPGMKGTAASGATPTKVVYDANNKVYRELPNEHYGKLDWNNAFRFMGESVPGLAEWIAAEETGAGVSKALGAAKNAQRISGLTAAAYLTGYDNNRKTADQLIEDTGTMGEAKKAILANVLTLSTAAVFKALDYSPSKFVEQALSKSAAPDAIKILEEAGWEKLSQEQSERLIKDQILPRAKAIVSKLGENITQGVKVGAATVADQKIKDLISVIANPNKAQTSTVEENVRSMVEQSLLMSVIGLPGAVKSGFESPSMKDALYQAGTYSPQYVDRINTLLENGQIDQGKANQLISVIKTMGEEVAKASSEKTIDGLPTTNQQKKEIALANFRKRAALQLKDQGVTGTEPAIGEADKHIKETKSQNFFEDLQPQIDLIEKDRELDLKETPPENHNEVNAKYDAEIIALEQGGNYEAKVREKEVEQNVPRSTFHEEGQTGAEKQSIIEDATKVANEDLPEYMRGTFTADVKESLREAAQQLNATESEAIVARKFYGERLSDLALKLYPNEKPPIMAHEMEKAISELADKPTTDNYTEHVSPILKRINDADYINEKELNKGADVLYSLLDRVDKRTDLSPEQKKSVNNLIEPLITKIEDYDFRTKTETRTVTETVPTKVATEVKGKREVIPALEQSKGSDATVTLPSGETRKGKLSIKSGQYVLDVPGSEQLVLGEKAITDRDLKLPDENKVPEPIAFDEDGNVKSVTFETRNGNLVTIDNPEKALDIAIQLRADEIGEVPQPEFDLVYNEIQKEIQEEKLVKQEPTKEQPNSQTINTDQNAKSNDQKGSSQESQAKSAPEKQSSQRNDEGQKINNEGAEPAAEAPLNEPSGEKKEPDTAATETTKGSGITHAANEQRRLEGKMNEYEKKAQTFEEWDKSADELLKDGYNVDKLISEIEKTNRPTNEIENAILKKYIATVDAEIEKNPTPELAARRKRFVLMKDLSNSAAGRQLVSIKGFAEAGDNLGSFLTEKMEANGVNELTQEQIDKQKSSYEEIKKSKDEYIAAMEALKAEKARLLAEKEVKKAAAETKKNKVKTHEDYVRDRATIVEKMRADLLRAAKGGGGLTASIPGAAQLKAIAPHVAKLVGSLVEEGVTKLDEMITHIHNEVKDIVEGISKTDIRNIISGEYNERKQTKNDLTAIKYSLKREADLLNQIDKARKGEEPKEEKKKFEKDRRILELENKLKEVRSKNKEQQAEDEGVQEAGKQEKTYHEKLADRQKQIKNQIADIEDKISKKIYSDEKPLEAPLRLDKKTLELQDKLIDLKRNRSLELARDMDNRKSRAAKALDKTMQVLGLKRIIQTAVDFSMPFRQAVITTMNPFKIKTTAEAFKNMFVHTFKPKEFKRFMFELEESGLKHEMDLDKMTLSQPDELVMDKREEEYRTSLLDRLRQSKNKAVTPLKWLLEPVFASERAAASYMNTVRINEYVKKMSALKEAGITRENNPQAYLDMAKWIMNSTGRGNMLKALEDSKAGREIAGNTFYGARLMASRFNMLNPTYYFKMPKEVRVEAMKDMAGFVSGIGLTGLALVAAGGKVNFDKDAPDFMQVRFGDKVYDLTGGMVQYVRTFLRLADLSTQVASNAVKSDPYKKDDMQKYAAFTTKSTVKFFTNKLAPNTAYIYHAMTGKGGDGKDFKPSEILNYYPMYVDDLRTGIEKDGTSALLTILAPSLFGMGVQQYEN